MSYAIELMGAVCFFHLIYEYIIAPSRRLRIRVELSFLEEELKNLKGKHGADFRQDAYNELLVSIKSLRNNISRYEISTLVSALREMSINKELQERFHHNIIILNNCRVREVQNLRGRISHAGVFAFKANSLGWSIYLVPLFIITSCVKLVKKAVEILLYSPPKEFDDAVNQGASY